jgi:antitoxin (DNA-binding transcriptional repressor) of toxin-antitoxin stability system
MPVVTVEEAQAGLPELIQRAARGEEVIITRDHLLVARLVAISTDRPQPVPGSCKGMLTIVSDDDEHLADFKEYMW